MTLDGTETIHNKRRFLKGGAGTFDKIVRGIDACLKNNIPVNLRMVVDKENIDNLPELAQLAIDKGWTKSTYLKPRLAGIMNYIIVSQLMISCSAGSPCLRRFLSLQGTILTFLNFINRLIRLPDSCLKTGNFPILSLIHVRHVKLNGHLIIPGKSIPVPQQSERPTNQLAHSTLLSPQFRADRYLGIKGYYIDSGMQGM